MLFEFLGDLFLPPNREPIYIYPEYTFHVNGQIK